MLQSISALMCPGVHYNTVVGLIDIFKSLLLLSLSLSSKLPIGILLE